MFDWAFPLGKLVRTRLEGIRRQTSPVQLRAPICPHDWLPYGDLTQKLSYHV